MEDDYELYYKKGIYLLKGIAVRYKESSLKKQQQITGVIFPEKIVYSENSYRTITRIPSLKYHHNGSAFRRKRKKERSEYSDLSCL